jgi:hypothetical protein
VTLALLTTIYLLAVLLFVAIFAATRLSASFAEVLRTSKDAISIFRDPASDDDSRERAARQASWELLRQAFAIIIKAALSLLGALLPFWAADTAGLKPWSETIAFASRPDVLVVTTFVGLGIWWMWWRREP